MKVREPRRAVEVPGDGPLHNVDDDPNSVARDREQTLKARATATAEAQGKKPDIAPEVDVDDGPVEKKILMAGEEVSVVVPRSKRVSEDVQKFGAESRLVRGTMVNKDGTPCQDGKEPYGVIGDIKTTHGILVNRVIPLDSIKGGAP